MNEKMNEVEILKANVKISDLLIGEWYEVNKISEWNFKIKCVNPSHNDENPSLTINKNLKWFKCWSCGVQWDVFNMLDYINLELKSFRSKILYLQKNYLWIPVNTDILLNGKNSKKENYQDYKEFIDIMDYICIYWQSKLSNEIKYKYILSNKKIIYRSFKWILNNMNWYGLSDEIIDDFFLYLAHCLRIFCAQCILIF
jgi:DNA primase